MFAIILLLLIILWLVGLSIGVIVKSKKEPKFSHTLDEIYDNFYSHKEKYTYRELHQSFANEKILILSSNKQKKIFSQKYLYKRMKFLLSLSKFIDFKINFNTQKYRAKKNKILIEEIASVVSNSVYLSNECKLFSLYKKLSNVYGLKIKENKIFKVLLGQQLIYRLFEIEEEMIQISKIIFKSKKTKKIKKFKKKIFLYAELYSIKKYNPNASKILAKEKINFNKLAGVLFEELSEAQKKEKIIISYLTIMFS